MLPGSSWSHPCCKVSKTRRGMKFGATHPGELGGHEQGPGGLERAERSEYLRFIKGSVRVKEWPFPVAPAALPEEGRNLGLPLGFRGA